MNKELIKNKLISFSLFIGISFLVDLILSLIIKSMNLRKLLVLNGSIYLIYGAILLITYMVFDNARTYEKIHNKKHLLPLPKEVRIGDIVYTVLGGFILIALEALFR